MIGLTERQRLVLDCIHEAIEAHGCPPTQRELGARLGVRSTNGVRQHLHALERKGYIRLDPRAARGICVLPPGARRRAEASNCEETTKQPLSS